VKGDIDSDSVTEVIDIHKRLDTNLMTGNILVRNISSNMTTELSALFIILLYTL